MANILLAQLIAAPGAGVPVDSDGGSCGAAVFAVERAGHVCQQVTDDLAALAAWRSGRFEVVVVDVDARGDEGFALIQNLHDAGARRFIALTASDDPAVGERLWELDVDQVLSKPVGANALAYAVRSLTQRDTDTGPDAATRAELEALFQRRMAGMVETIDRLRESRKRARLAQEEVIHALSSAAEFGYDARSVHTYRVGRYAALLAVAAGLPREEAERIRLAAALHDVGNVGIDGNLLTRTDALSDAERAEVERHTRVGLTLLAGFETPMLECAASIALTHHERWDGSGYPDGLAGERIPLEGRIVAIADVFDAMVSDRPYRPALTIDDAFAFITAKAGILFDPFLVRAFVDRRAEVERLAAKYADYDRAESASTSTVAYDFGDE